MFTLSRKRSAKKNMLRTMLGVAKSKGFGRNSNFQTISFFSHELKQTADPQNGPSEQRRRKLQKNLDTFSRGATKALSCLFLSLYF